MIKNNSLLLIITELITTNKVILLSYTLKWGL